MSILRYDQIDLNDVKVSDLILTKDKRKVFNVLYKNRPLMIQTPTMYAPFGVSEYKPNGEVLGVSLDLSFGKEDQPEYDDLRRFRAFVEAIETKLIQKVAENSHKCFGSVYDANAVREHHFKSQIRDKENNEYPALLKVKIPKDREDRFPGKVFDLDRKERDLKFVAKGSKVTAILELRSGWIVSSNCGVTFKAEQLRAEPPTRYNDYAFVDAHEDSKTSADTAMEDSTMYGDF